MGLASDSSLNRGVVRSWLAWMRETNADYHLASRALAEFDKKSSVASMASFLVQSSVSTPDEQNTMADVAADGDATLNEAAKIFLEDLRQALLLNTSAKDSVSWEAWQHHVRSVTPRFVMRTSALQKIGVATEVGKSEVLREAWSLLVANPFLIEAGRSTFRNAGSRASKKSGGVFSDLAALPGPRERFLQTSCGGQ